MTTDELVNVLALSLPASSGADAKVIAKSLLNMAVIKIGRMKNIPFNERVVPFALISGKKEYEIGRELFSGLNVQNIRDMGRTDTAGYYTEIKSPEQFADVAKGGTATGYPAVGTILRRNNASYLALYPIPDSAYAVEASVKVAINRIEDIPSQYHDALVPIAISVANAIKDPRVAIELAKEGLKDIQDCTMTGWSGTVIPAARNLGDQSSGVRADSMNLR